MASATAGSSAAGSAWAALPVADGPVPDVGHGRRHQGSRPAGHRRALDGGVADAGADGEPARPGVDGVEPGDAADVDKVGGMAQPQRQQRDEALPAGQDLGVGAVLGQQADRLLHGSRAVVAERRHLHRRPPSAGHKAR